MPLTIDEQQAIRDYVGPNAVGGVDARTVAAEKALQAATCRVPADDDDSPAATQARTVLFEALCRRVVVNLARRGLPLGMQMTDVGTARISTNDPEVRRLEGPYRKVVLG